MIFGAEIQIFPSLSVLHSHHSALQDLFDEEEEADGCQNFYNQELGLHKAAKAQSGGMEI